MIVILFCSIVALFLTYLDSKQKINNGMLMGFVIVTFLAAIRYKYGNDYNSYLELYNDINYGSFNNLKDYVGVYDIGWVFLCLLFKSTGFQSLVAFVSILQCFGIYYIIKKSVPRRLWFCSIFVFLFTQNFYLLEMSMMRQGLSMTLCFLSSIAIIDKQYLRCLLLLVFAYTIHASSMIFIPFILLAFANNKVIKLFPLIICILFIVLSVSKDIISTIFNQFLLIGRIQDYYNTYQNRDSVESYGMGYLLSILPLFVSLWAIWKNKLQEQYKPLVMMSCIGYLFAPFESIILLIGRTSLYFFIINIVVIPITYDTIRNKVIKNGLVILYIFITIIGYYLFLAPSSIYHDHYYNYKSVFTSVRLDTSDIQQLCVI